MKKSFLTFAFLLLGIILFSTTSCSKEENPAPKKKEFIINIKVSNTTQGDTKAVKTGWVNGDKIFVFFSEYLYQEDYITLTYNDGNWIGVSSYDLDGSEDQLGTDGTMFALYFPFGNVVVDDDGTNPFYVSFMCSSSTNPALNDIPVFSYSMTNGSGSAYHIETEGDISTLTGTLNMRIPANYVQFYIAESGGNYNQNDKYRLSVEGVKPMSMTFDFVEEKFSSIELGAGQPMWGYKYGDGIAFSGIIDDSWSTPSNHKMIFFSDGDPAVSKTFTGKTLSSHDAIKLKAPIAANGWSNAVEAPSYTQMRDGTKWADLNLCSTNLDDVLDASTTFRWKEIVPNGSGTYFNYEGENSLEGNYAIYDAARALLGSNWRMPTILELTNLSNNSNRSVHDGGTVTKGVFTRFGMIFENKDDATKSIMLPVNDGTSASYWSCTYNVFDRAHYANITNGNVFSIETSTRDERRYIRPIYVGE